MFALLRRDDGHQPWTALLGLSAWTTDEERCQNKQTEVTYVNSYQLSQKSKHEIKLAQWIKGCAPFLIQDEVDRSIDL